MAWAGYGKPSDLPSRWARKARGLHELVKEKWLVDRLYHSTFVQGTLSFSRFLWRWVDDVLIDGTVFMIGLSMQILGEFLRMFQTGLTRNYALALFLGSLAVLVYVVI